MAELNGTSCHIKYPLKKKESKLDAFIAHQCKSINHSVSDATVEYRQGIGSEGWIRFVIQFKHVVWAENKMHQI
jgi:hypothetical protein